MAEEVSLWFSQSQSSNQSTFSLLVVCHLRGKSRTCLPLYVCCLAWFRAAWRDIPQNFF